MISIFLDNFLQTKMIILKTQTINGHQICRNKKHVNDGDYTISVFPDGAALMCHETVLFYCFLLVNSLLIISQHKALKKLESHFFSHSFSSTFWFFFTFFLQLMVNQSVPLSVVKTSEN